jgi:proteic killer suppression protein
VRRFPHSVIDLAVVKLDMLNAAVTVLDLRSPPGNRLEALKGDLQGFHSIRVNDQWRIVFRWEGNNAGEVRLVDYHR